MIENNLEVDKNNKIIGLRPLEDFYTGKYIHRASHLILFNSKNEILLQQRAKTKNWYPNLFSYSASGAVANESYLNCIKRETLEEIGICIKFQKLFIYPFFDILDKAWHCVFTGKTDQKIKPDNIEMQKIIWIDIDQLKRDIIKNPKIYAPPFLKGIKIYFQQFDINNIYQNNI